MDEAVVGNVLNGLINRGDNYNGGNWIWMIVIVFMWMFCGGGFWGNRNNNCASTADVQNQFNFAALERQNNEIVAAVRQAQYDNGALLQQGQNEIQTVVKDTAYNNLSGIRDIEAAIASLQAAQSQCCCETNRNIDAVRYEAAQNTCTITSAIHAEGEATRQLMTANTIQELRDKLQAAQLANSQCAQNAYLINALRPAPMPSVPASSYYGFSGNPCASMA